MTMSFYPAIFYFLYCFISATNAAVATGAVRLYRNGVPDTTQSWSSGIVQIYYSSQWGNICDDTTFGSDEADVICHQLGYTGASSYSNTGYTTTWGNDYSTTVMDDVSCSTSSYLTITQCSFSTSISFSCGNSADVVVTCYSTRIWDSPSSGNIRLTGGVYSNQGLLEVYCNGQWGTVCDDSFYANEAVIACRQLGYNSYVDYDHLSFQINASQSIWLNTADSCYSSTATCLTSCGACPLTGITICLHNEDITLECRYSTTDSKEDATITSICLDKEPTPIGTIRLFRNGAPDTSQSWSSEPAPIGTIRLFRNDVPDITQSWSSGIVQIYYNDEWGNICDDSSFGSDEADVICHQLGYTGASSYSNNGITAIWGTDYSTTAMNGVHCSTSSYLTITQCSFNTAISSSCSNSKDVVLTCYSTRIWDSPSSGDIRLTGGVYSNQGLLEVYCNGQWGTVCDDSFYANEAVIACRQLGYNSYVNYDHLSFQINASQSIWLNTADSCFSSTDACLTSCGACPSTAVTSCSHNEDITLECRYSTTDSKEDATTTNICFDKEPAPIGTIRLFRNGVPDITQSWSSGIVQIYYNDEWGNICDDSSFGSDEADVICHQLGYTGASSYSNTGSTTTWGNDSSNTVMNYVSCGSSYSLTITQCTYSTSFLTTECNDATDVIVECYSTRIWDSPVVGDIRLTGGTYSNQGLLEVYCNGQWGTVCDNSFTYIEARIACRQLGYNHYDTYDQLTQRGNSSQSIWLDTTSTCSSTSDTCLTSCGNCPSSHAVASCSHSEDITLACEHNAAFSKVSTFDSNGACASGKGAAYSGSVRLYRNGVGDTTQSWSSGIVQIYNYEWGNICDDSSFGSDEADVICHQLGYTGASSYSNTGSTTIWGVDSSSAVLRDVVCSTSSYLTVTQCSYITGFIQAESGCDDTTDIAVSCYSTRIWDSPSPGDIRLTGGTYTNQGLLEIYCNGEWGTVCDDYFDGNEARVACRQLGYNYYESYSNTPLEGTSSQPIWLWETYDCSSSYSCLTNCESCPSRRVLGCSHSEDINLICQYSSSIVQVTTDNSTDCDISSAGVTTGAIIGAVVGSIIGFIVCLALIVGIPICICMCLGVGLGASARGRPRTRVVNQPATTTATPTAATTGTQPMYYSAKQPSTQQPTTTPYYPTQPPSAPGYSTVPNPSNYYNPSYNPAAYPSAGYPTQPQPMAVIYPPPQNFGYPPQVGCTPTTIPTPPSECNPDQTSTDVPSAGAQPPHPYPT